MVEKVAPKKTKSGAIKDITIAKALKANNGLQVLTAEMLGVTHQCISKRVKASAYLREVIDHCTELGLDEAQRGLRNKILAEDLGAICFMLKTKGRHRGFTESSQLIVSPEISSMFDAQMRQLKELQSDRKNAQSNT